MCLRTFLSLALLPSLCLPGGAQAPAPRTIGFTGALRSASGAPISGTRTVKLSLYSAPTGGSAEWSETQTVAVSGGLFSAALGAVNPFPAGMDFGNAYFVGVAVGSDPEMAPRIALQGVPYALHAQDVADGAVSAAKLEPGLRASLVTQPAALLVVNGGFEEWPGGDAAWPAAWTAFGSGISPSRVTSATPLPATALSGSSLQLAATGANQAAFQRAFAGALAPNTQYTISCRRKIVSVSGAPVMRSIYVSLLNMVAGTPARAVTAADTDWVTDSVTFTTPAAFNTLAYEGLYLGLNSSGGTGGFTVLYDNVVCAPGAAPAAYSGADGYVRTQDGAGLALAGAAGQVLISDGTAFRASAPTTAVLSLPPTVYATEGHECNVYFDDVTRADIPADQLRFQVSCAKGLQQAERWTYTPTAADAGTTTLKIEAYWQNALVATRTANLLTTTAGAGAGASRRVLVIGDSTTARGEWLSELTNLFNVNRTSPAPGGGPDAMSIATTGSVSIVAADSGGAARTVRHDALYGWRAVQFLSNDGSPGYPRSPFVSSIGRTFDFPWFLSTNGITLSPGDWVLFHLGINDVVDASSDAMASGMIAVMRSSLDTMMARIRAAAPGVRIGVMLTIPPSASQDAFAGSTFTSGTFKTRWRYKRSRDLLVESLIAAYGSSGGVYLFGTNACLDPVHGMKAGDPAPANSRTATTVVRQSDAVHPAESGYWQMADCVYAALKGVESQSGG